MQHEERETPAPQGRRRPLARWACVVFVAALLLGASQVLWLWQTWPVRHLLEVSQ